MDSVDNANQNISDFTKKRKSKGFVQLLLKRSTIPALVQINTPSHITTKVFWCLLLFCGLAISVYQSYVLISAYLKFSVNEKESVVLKVPLPIPAVTICSNKVIDWDSENAIETVNITGMLEEMNVTDFDDINVKQSEDGHDKLMLKLATFNETQRINLGVSVKEFLLVGDYEDETSSNDSDIMKLESNNIFFGNCLTVDANRYRNHSFKANFESGYYMFALLVQNVTGFTSVKRQKSIVGTVHQSGTPPIMKLENTFQIYPGESVEIRVAQKEINRLPWPYESECVQDDNPSEQWKSLYHSEENPFYYTMEACRDSCLQNLSYTYCNCVNPMLGIRGDLLNLTEFCYYGCNKIPVQEVVRMCGCRDSCRHLEFTFLEKRNPNALKEPTFKKQFMKMLMGDISEEALPIVEKFLENLAIFTVSTSSNFASVVEEEAAITAADLGGAIGGVFGLWIGLSAMSLFEVFAAAQAAILSHIKRIWYLYGKKAKRQSEIQPKINMSFEGCDDELPAVVKRSSDKPLEINTRL